MTKAINRGAAICLCAILAAATSAYGARHGRNGALTMDLQRKAASVRVHERTAEYSHKRQRAASDPIPLDPDHGGRSITQSSLEKGDIIVSTTTDLTSALIRKVTGDGPVSHACIYVDHGQVIEAVGNPGVTPADLATALQHDSVAVAFRYPGISTTGQDQVVDFAWQQLGKPYDYWGAIQDALFSYVGVRVP